MADCLPVVAYAERASGIHHRRTCENTPYEVRLHSRNDKYISLANRLGEALAALRTADAGNNPWPSDVPRLDPQLSELCDEEEHAAYDLGCFATAFLLLHETCHAQKRVRGEPEGGIAEEIDATSSPSVF